jgi:hypothetical protein
MRPRLLLAIAAILLGAALVFVGCSGSGGPAMPSPATPDRPDPTPIVVEDLIVPAGEERRVEEDTVFTVDGIVQIDGALIGADGSGAGAHGVDITIEAEGDISVTGLIQAGRGVDGASDEAGGDGGSVSLTSTGGSITIGTEDEVAPASNDRHGLHAGDGGDGGEGLLGGPGGKGGSVLLACASGTLTIHEAPGLFHIGSGGHGGQGVLGGEDLETFEPPAHLLIPFEETGIELPSFDDPGWEGDAPEEFELPENVLQIPSHGGDSGRLIMDAQELIGPETEEVSVPDTGPVLLVHSDIELVSGAAGGSGGSFTLRSEAVGNAALRAQSSDGAKSDSVTWEVRGANGGSGDRQGGDGGDIDNSGGGSAFGGHGGEVNLASGFLRGIWYVYRTARSGRGGDATATSDDGSDGDACSSGWFSSICLAFGGNGGSIEVSGLGQARNTSFFAGRGGDAKAISGNGGNGGDCCGASSGPGGDGGNSGHAIAQGGLAGSVFGAGGAHVNRGRGGNAEAHSGRGGNGGDGRPPGAGGKASFASAIAGIGAPRGEASTTKGADGAPGDPCPEAPAPDPDPTPDRPTEYGITTSNSPARRIEFFPGIYVAAPTAQQLQPDVTIGGPGNRVLPPLGASVVFKRDNSLLWCVDELTGTAKMFSNPLPAVTVPRT